MKDPKGNSKSNGKSTDGEGVLGSLPGTRPNRLGRRSTQSATTRSTKPRAVKSAAPELDGPRDRARAKGAATRARTKPTSKSQSEPTQRKVPLESGASQLAGAALHAASSVGQAALSFGYLRSGSKVASSTIQRIVTVGSGVFFLGDRIVRTAVGRIPGR